MSYNQLAREMSVFPKKGQSYTDRTDRWTSILNSSDSEIKQNITGDNYTDHTLWDAIAKMSDLKKQTSVLNHLLFEGTFRTDSGFMSELETRGFFHIIGFNLPDIGYESIYTYLLSIDDLDFKASAIKEGLELKKYRDNLDDCPSLISSINNLDLTILENETPGVIQDITQSLKRKLLKGFYFNLPRKFEPSLILELDFKELSTSEYINILTCLVIKHRSSTEHIKLGIPENMPWLLLENRYPNIKESPFWEESKEIFKLHEFLEQNLFNWPLTISRVIKKMNAMFSTLTPINSNVTGLSHISFD